MVASTQSAQLNRRKKIHNLINEQARNTARSLFAAGLLENYFNKTNEKLHIVLSCDQKFCRNFLSGLHELLARQKFAEEDRIWLFGHRSKDLLSDIATNSKLSTYKTVSLFEECESIALKIMELRYPQVFMYSYLDDGKSFKKTDILDFSKYTNLTSEDIILFDDQININEVLHFFLASEIYNHVLQTGLRERIERAMAMSEASSNAENKARYLKSLYNKTRQSLITKEITNGT